MVIFGIYTVLYSDSYLSKTDLMTNILYVSVTAVLAWAISCQSPFICSAAYCIIIPTFIIAHNYNIASLKVGAYFIVFYKDYHWEERLHKVNIISRGKINRFSASFKLSYIFIGILCTILSWIIFLSNENNFDNIMLWINCVGDIVLTAIFIIVVLLQKNSDEIKQIYIDNWEVIRQNEQDNLSVEDEQCENNSSIS